MQKNTIMGLVISFLMVASIFGVALDYIANDTQTLKYNGFKFQPIQNAFKTTIKGKPYAFTFYPQDIEYIKLSEDVNKTLASPILTVTYDPASIIADGAGQAQYYMESQLDGVTVIDRGVTNNTGTTLPIRTCADATANQPVVFLTLSNQSDLSVTNNCLTLRAISQDDLFRETERIIYHILGVMP